MEQRKVSSHTLHSHLEPLFGFGAEIMQIWKDQDKPEKPHQSHGRAKWTLCIYFARRRAAEHLWSIVSFLEELQFYTVQDLCTHSAEMPELCTNSTL